MDHKNNVTQRWNLRDVIIPTTSSSYLCSCYVECVFYDWNVISGVICPVQSIFVRTTASPLPSAFSFFTTAFNSARCFTTAFGSCRCFTTASWLPVGCLFFLLYTTTSSKLTLFLIFKYRPKTNDGWSNYGCLLHSTLAAYVFHNIFNYYYV